jgi:hypothetical protein
MPPSSQRLRVAFGERPCRGSAHVAPALQLTKGMENHEMPHSEAEGARYHGVLRLGLGVFLSIAFFFLWQEHRAHLLGALPWLLLLACPLMHTLMHRRHGGHRDHGCH